MVDTGKVSRLHRLEGQRPLQLVVQREARDLLRGVTEQDGWRVCPRLSAAIEQALKEYHRARAPLTKLNPIQRLGYLDEEDALECCKDLVVRFIGGGQATFRAGERYPLRSQTITVKRVSEVPNMAGVVEKVEYQGSQLALFAMAPSREVCFLDEALREGHTLHDGKVNVDATLQDLVAHFVIPEVPDLATLEPDRHALMLARLTQLEADVANV